MIMESRQPARARGLRKSGLDAKDARQQVAPPPAEAGRVASLTSRGAVSWALTMETTMAKPRLGWGRPAGAGYAVCRRLVAAPATPPSPSFAFAEC